MVGCVDAEQGQATGQHRPGGFGEREPGAVGGRGFLRTAGKDGGQQGQDGIGDGDEVPGETVGGAVGCRLGEDAGVIREQGGDVVPYVPGFGVEPQVGGVTAESPGAGVGVPDAEERVALTLDEVLVGDTGPVMTGGMKQGPAGGVAAELEGAVPAGAGTGRTTNSGGETESCAPSASPPTPHTPPTPRMSTQRGSRGPRTGCGRRPPGIAGSDRGRPSPRRPVPHGDSSAG